MEDRWFELTPSWSGWNEVVTTFLHTHTHQDLDAVNTSLLFRLMVCLLSLLLAWVRCNPDNIMLIKQGNLDLKLLKVSWSSFSVVCNFLRNLNQYSRGTWKCGMNCDRYKIRQERIFTKSGLKFSSLKKAKNNKLSSMGLKIVSILIHECATRLVKKQFYW